MTCDMEAKSSSRSIAHWLAPASVKTFSGVVALPTPDPTPLKVIALESAS